MPERCGSTNRRKYQRTTTFPCNSIMKNNKKLNGQKNGEERQTPQSTLQKHQISLYVLRGTVFLHSGLEREDIK